MVNRTFLVKTFLILALLSAVYCKQEYGLCSAVNSEIPDKSFNVSKAMGIWYEYLVTPELKGNNTYTCASWLML
jgi:hypothetical protein